MNKHNNYIELWSTYYLRKRYLYILRLKYKLKENKKDSKCK